MFFAGRVAGGGGESVGSRREGLSRMLSSMVFGDEGDKGVIGRGLSGDGVRGIERKGGARGLSLRDAPSMLMFVVGEVLTGVSNERDVEELIRKIGRGVSCVVWRAFFVGWGTRKRAGGRSGGRKDVTFRKRMGVR